MAVTETTPIFTEITPMTAPSRKSSLTDLTDEQWESLQPLIPPAKDMVKNNFPDCLSRSILTTE